MTNLRTIFVMLTALVGVLAPAHGSALDAETADLVSGYTIDVPRSFAIDEDDGTVFVGATGCEAMLPSSRIAVNFATTFSPGAQPGLLEEVDMFTVPRDSTARIDCLSGELCQLVDRDDYHLTASGVSVDVAFSDLLAVGDFTQCADIDQEFFVRLVVEKSTTSDVIENADAKIVVDTIAPAAPSNLVASATQSTLKVSFTESPDRDVNRYFVYWATTPFDGGIDADAVSLQRRVLGERTEGSITVSLNPGEPLFVAVAAEDLAGNLSVLSNAHDTPIVETFDFWQEYKRAGGQETGGCNTVSDAKSLLPTVLVFILLLGVVRRRKLLQSQRSRRLTIATILFAVLTMLAPLTASAETKIWGAFDLKLGGYYPAIDDEFGGEGPFSSIFGTKNMLMGELEVAGWIWQGFGKFGIAGHAGYSRVKGSAVVSDDAEGAEDVDDTTSFMVVPLRASLVYRFDWLALHTPVPLSFSVKVGPDIYRWRVANANGDTATVGDAVGSGWKKGWHAAFGVQFLLDFLHKSAAAAFDLHWGINNSYIFAEYMITKVDDFGGDGFDLSDDLLLFGLSFEF